MESKAFLCNGVIGKNNLFVEKCYECRRNNGTYSPRNLKPMLCSKTGACVNFENIREFSFTLCARTPSYDDYVAEFNDVKVSNFKYTLLRCLLSIILFIRYSMPMYRSKYFFIRFAVKVTVRIYYKLIFKTKIYRHDPLPLVLEPCRKPSTMFFDFLGKCPEFDCLTKKQCFDRQ